MRSKNWLCAALVGLPICAAAQVTIYGIADVGAEIVNHVVPSGGSIKRLVSGAAHSSRLGFRGVEDLGGGARALFQLEQGIDLDTGTLGQGGRGFGRLAVVGLENAYGRILLGRNQTTILDYVVVFDPVAPSRYSSPLLDPAYAARVDNSVKANLRFGQGGSFTALYSVGAELAANTRAARQFGFGAAYKFGPLTLGAAFDNVAGGTAATESDTVKRSAVGAVYDLSVVKLYASYTHRDNLVARVQSRAGQYWVGFAMQPIANFTLTAAYYGFNARSSGDDANAVSALLTYSFSKRSDLYLHASTARNEGRANMGVTGFGTVAAGQNQAGATLGLRHRF